MAFGNATKWQKKRPLNLNFFVVDPLIEILTLTLFLKKLREKMQGWKGKTLSKAGMIQLLNSTISNISSYTMKSFTLPKGIHKKINKKMRGFFWGHESTIGNFHPVSWEKICTLKSKGGLGIRDPEHQNNVLFLNLIWKISTTPNLYL